MFKEPTTYPVWKNVLWIIYCWLRATAGGVVAASVLLELHFSRVYAQNVGFAVQVGFLLWEAWAARLRHRKFIEIAILGLAGLEVLLTVMATLVL